MAAIAAISSEAPSVKVIVLTVSEEESDLVTALEAGARAYVLKGPAPPELLRIIGTVVNGECYVAPGLAARAIMRMRKTAEPVKPKAMTVSGLTNREGEILNAAAEGLTNKEVANRLGLS